MGSMSSDNEEIESSVSIERVFLNVIILLFLLNIYAFLYIEQNSAEYFIVIINFIILSIFLAFLITVKKRRIFQK